MRKIKIIDDNNESYFIKNLNCSMEKNTIKIKWDWPDYDTNIKFVYRYEVEDVNENLEGYLKRNAEKLLISRSNYTTEDYCYSEVLKDRRIQFRFFPIIIEKNIIYIYNQKFGNCSDIFYKPITLNVKIKYDYRNFFSGFKIATFVFKDTEKLKELENNSLFYYKINVKTMQVVCTYPVNIEAFCDGNYAIVVENGFKIKLYSDKKYRINIKD